MKHKLIPEVHDGNDVLYWKEIFPKSYTNRAITDLNIDGIDFIVDGDVRFTFKAQVKGNKHITKRETFCTCCNTYVNKWKPKMFGSIDVGYELVYFCSNCGNGKYRIYDKVNGK